MAGPPVFVLLLIWFGRLTWAEVVASFQRNWTDDPASLWGLVIAVYVLVVAIGARRAAQDARSDERLRTALAGLEDAADKCTQVGQFARHQKWDVVELRAREVMACCRTTLAAWGDNPALAESRKKLNEVAVLMRSIIEESRNQDVNGKTILTAQLNSDEKLSVVVGKIQKEHKSGSL